MGGEGNDDDDGDLGWIVVEVALFLMVALAIKAVLWLTEVVDG